MFNAKYVIINYHYVEDPRPERGGIHPCPVAEFERQIKWLADNYRVASIKEVFEAAKTGSTEKVCAITFDDGLKDQYENALPILKKYKATATFFPIASVFDAVAPIAQQLHFAISRFKAEELVGMFNQFLTASGYDRVESAIPLDCRINATRKLYDGIPTANFKERMNTASRELSDAFFNHIYTGIGASSDSVLHEFFMDHAMVIDLNKRGFEIGSHGWSHTALDKLPIETAEEDIARASKVLEEMLGAAPKIFSYPHGGVTNELMEALKKQGFEYAVATADIPEHKRGILATDDPLLLRQFDTTDFNKILRGITG